MQSGNELRQKYLNFFKARDHQIVPSAPIVLAGDPTTLFTGSGMQPMMPYLLGAAHPLGKRLADSQKSFRAGDIEEIGDNRHQTLFEMLGNWSLGDYFKAEQLPWIFEFLTREVGLDPRKLYVTVFIGDQANGVAKDLEAIEIWKKIFASVGIDAPEIDLDTEANASEVGMQGGHIFAYGVTKNWWARNGAIPATMPVGEPGGPDSEIFYDFGTSHNPKFGKQCHPNCDCGRFLEIGNSVFMQYQKQADGTLKELSQKNIDFGGGLERILAASNNDPDVFKTDLFLPIIQALEEVTGKKYLENAPAMRVITDHLKGSVMMISEGLLPGNKQQDYILRRLLRRAVLKLNHLKPNLTATDLGRLVESIFSIYEGVYLDRERDLTRVSQVVIAETERFQKTLARGLRELEKQPRINGRTAFDLLSTFGFPWELTLEIAKEKGQTVDRAQFEAEFKKHQDLSRTASAGMFKGGLADRSEIVTKYHTATHLLQQALRDILGDHVHQAGSNLTAERLRFDFTHGQALTPDQIKEVETTLNAKIAANLPVIKKEMAYDDAIKAGALAFFKEKYPPRVTVYQIGDYSLELCGGPHLANTSEIGKIKIIKQESLGASLRRVYLKLV